MYALSANQRLTSTSCAAYRYGLDELKRLALRKQGLRSGIQISTILSSARWTYSHTPDTDADLRAHYLALIIRSRNHFKRSGTMEKEMNLGGKLFFDLFVAMCNQMVSSRFSCPSTLPFHHVLVPVLAHSLVLVLITVVALVLTHTFVVISFTSSTQLSSNYISLTPNRTISKLCAHPLPAS